jgi:hypothetical protein
MNTISPVLAALGEAQIARTVGIPHDETRLRYRLERNTVESFEEFTALTGEYYNYHSSGCMFHGGRLSAADARGRAKEILEREYRRRIRGITTPIVAAYNDAHDGTNGGLRTILDLIADALKEESVSHYVTDVFDRFVAPNSWEGKVSIIRQFIEHCPVELSSSIRRDQAERYAQNYRELIQAYVDGLRQTSSMFRSL